MVWHMSWDTATEGIEVEGLAVLRVVDLGTVLVVVEIGQVEEDVVAGVAKEVEVLA